MGEFFSSVASAQLYFSVTGNGSKPNHVVSESRRAGQHVFRSAGHTVSGADHVIGRSGRE